VRILGALTVISKSRCAYSALLSAPSMNNLGHSNPALANEASVLGSKVFLRLGTVVTPYDQFILVITRKKAKVSLA
jgi:hypothetical protein